MKFSFTLSALLTCILLSADAQTNTFPSSGNAGIGITTPNARLHIRSEGSSPWLALDKNSNEETGLQFRKSGNVLFYLYSDNSDNDALKIQATGLVGENDASPRIHIPFHNKNIYLAQSGGNVAIGQAAPTARFNVQQVSGTWNDGIRLSLMSKNWDIVTDSDGDRLIVAKDQSLINSLVIYNGNVGIGSSYPSQKLTVNGTIYGKEILIDLNVPGPDYVFENDYNLSSLEEIKSYIEQHKHLPEVPSAKEMEANGINVGEMNMILLKKVEELTLHLIELKEQNKDQQKEIDALKKDRK